MCLSACLVACAKPRLQIPPCDEDLGYLSQKNHLANVKYLDEDRAIDWFELYDNLDSRKKGQPPQNCIPLRERSSIEQQIERHEHDVKNLR